MTAYLRSRPSSRRRRRNSIMSSKAPSNSPSRARMCARTWSANACTPGTCPSGSRTSSTKRSPSSTRPGPQMKYGALQSTSEASSAGRLPDVRAGTPGREPARTRPCVPPKLWASAMSFHALASTSLSPAASPAAIAASASRSMRLRRALGLLAGLGRSASAIRPSHSACPSPAVARERHAPPRPAARGRARAPRLLERLAEANEQQRARGPVGDELGRAAERFTWAGTSSRTRAARAAAASLSAARAPSAGSGAPSSTP